MMNCPICDTPAKFAKNFTQTWGMYKGEDASEYFCGKPNHYFEVCYVQNEITYFRLIFDMNIDICGDFYKDNDWHIAAGFYAGSVIYSGVMKTTLKEAIIFSKQLNDNYKETSFFL